MQNKPYQRKEAFTLIELLIVIVIIAVLAGIVVIAVNPGEKLAEMRDNERKTHLNTILSAVEEKTLMARGEWVCDPIPTDNFTVIGTAAGNYDLFSCLVPEYMSSEVYDPTDGTEEDTKYAIWQNAQTGDVSLRSLNSETKFVSTGVSGGALDFDGVDDYVDLGQSDVFDPGLGDVSYSIWFKKHYSETSNERVFNMGDGNVGEGYRAWASDTDIVVEFNYDGNRLIAPSTSHSGVNNWTHLVVAFHRDEEMKIYINGDLEVTRDISEAENEYVSTGPHNRIGMGESLNFTGKTDDVRIYDKALSASEVNDLHNGQNITDELVGSWPMNEMEGCVAGDHSGNNNDGTFQPDCPNNAPDWTRGR